MAETSGTSSEPEALDDLVSRGGIFLQEDKVEEARGCFDAALKLAPDDEKVLGLLGLTHFRLEDFDSASGIYEALVKKSPDDASYRLNLGLVHLKLDRADDAIRELDRSRSLDPSQIRTVSYLGLAHARNGDYAEAYEAFLRADQAALATEMEQYLDTEQQTNIRELVKAAVPQDLPVDEDADILETEEDQEADDISVDITEELEVETANEDAQIDTAFAAFDAAETLGDDDDEPPEETKVQVQQDAAIPRQNRSASGMITQAVSHVLPSLAATAQPAPLGHTPPQAVSALATERMLRPSEGGEPLEIGAGGVLIARVNHRLISRTQGVMVSSGELGFEPATRRVRGKQSDEIFGTGDAQLFVVTGEGYMVASACGEVFSAVRLDGDIVYVREQYVFAFDPDLRWENGRVPGSDFHVAQFRGTGCIAIRTPKDLLSVKLSSERVMYVESEVLAGWIGRVVPRLVKPAAGGRASTPFVECSGEGVVLLHDIQGPT